MAKCRSEEEISMKCPYCDNEMVEGCMVTDAKYVAFRKDRFASARVGKNEDGIQLLKNHIGTAKKDGIYNCIKCKKIIFDYE